MPRADVPDYDNIPSQGLDDFDEAAGGLWPDYPAVQFDSLLGVPVLIDEAVEKESTQNPGETYVIIRGTLLKKKTLMPKDDALDPIIGEPGTKFSSNSGAARVKHTVAQMIERGFDPPYKVMVSKVEGGHPKARKLVGI